MQNSGSTVQGEQRKGNRKILKTKAMLGMEGAAQAAFGRTVDVSGEGVSLLLDDALKPGALGLVRFEIFHAGKAASIGARVRVQYCILTNGQFKVGLQFVSLELSAMAVIARFLQ